MNSKTIFGQRVKQAMKDKGVSYRKLADRCGVTVATICNWTAGKVTPHYVNLNALADALGKYPSYFFGEDE